MVMANISLRTYCYQHHERVAVWICKTISSFWVDCLYYKRSFLLWLKLAFGLMCH